MTEIQKFMMATFVRVRAGVGIIGICFPFLLCGALGVFVTIFLSLDR